MEGTASLWIGGRIFRVEKRTRGSTALKQCLTERFNFVFKFKRNITYPEQFGVHRPFVRAKFWKRLEPSQFVGISPINDRPT